MPFVNNEYYHVYNRGVGRQLTYENDSDYAAAKLGLAFYQYRTPPMKLSFFKRLKPVIKKQVLESLRNEPRLVEFIAFSLMPNHFHLLIRQCVDGGLSTFCRRWLNSYSRYYNEKYARHGALYQEMFKAVLIRSNEQLLHVSRYIHLNHAVSNQLSIEELRSSPRTSLPEYLGSPILVNPAIILDQFSNRASYSRFLIDQIDYGRSLEQIKHLAFD